MCSNDAQEIYQCHVQILPPRRIVQTIVSVIHISIFDPISQTPSCLSTTDLPQQFHRLIQHLTIHQHTPQRAHRSRIKVPHFLRTRQQLSQKRKHNRIEPILLPFLTFRHRFSFVLSRLYPHRPKATIHVLARGVKHGLVSRARIWLLTYVRMTVATSRTRYESTHTCSRPLTRTSHTPIFPLRRTILPIEPTQQHPKHKQSAAATTPTQPRITNNMADHFASFFVHTSYTRHFRARATLYARADGRGGGQPGVEQRCDVARAGDEWGEAGRTSTLGDVECEVGVGFEGVGVCCIIAAIA